MKALPDTAVLALKEYEKREGVALTGAQAGDLYDHYRKFLRIESSWGRPGLYDLTASDHIGTIALPDLRLHIQPKVPLTNLFYMLTYAYDLVAFRDGRAPLAEGAELFEFLVKIFVAQVNQLVRGGIYRSYIDFREQHVYLRGRLLLAEQLRAGAVQATRFHQETNELTADLRENQILKTTLWRLSRAHLQDEALRRELRRTLSAFSAVSLRDLGPAECDRVIYNRLNERYRTPVNLAQLFLQHLSLEGHAGQTPFMTYLLPMYDVFEKFTGRYLQAHFAGQPRYRVDMQRKMWLDAEQKAEGRPDIVLWRDGRPFLVLDTKYKTFKDKPDPADLYQMFVYAHTLGVRRAILIYADPQPVNYKGTFQGVTIAAQSLALDGPLENFQARCRSFAAGFAREVEDLA